MNTITQCLVRWFGRKSCFYSFLEYVQPWSIVAAAISAVWAFSVFIWEKDDRHQRQIWDAWLVVNSAHDGRGSSGRRKALEILVKDGESLDGIVIARADISGINLEGANLRNAIVCDSILKGANLRSTDLRGVDFRMTEYSNADFTGALFDENSKLGVRESSGARGLDSEEAKAAVRRGPPSCCDAGKVSTHPCSASISFSR
jgi:hypothetical protein